MANATNPTATSVLPPVLIDEETLDLSVPEPVPTAHLSLQHSEYYKAHYYKNCWALEPGETLGLTLRLDDQDQLTLTYELYAPEDPSIRYFYQSYAALGGDDWRAPLYSTAMFSDGGSVNLQLDCDALAQDFFKVTTPLAPLGEQQVGDNTCTLNYAGLIKPLFVRAVTLKRFRVQHQEQTEWCWAAVTASLLSLLGPANESQSEVVHQALGGQAGDLNRQQDITAIAKKLGLAVKYTSRQLKLYELRDGIKQGLPIPLQINWRVLDAQGQAVLDKDGAEQWGSGHYVVLSRIGPDVPGGDDQVQVKIEDPSKGELQMTFAELKNDYPGAANKQLYQTPHSGVWTYTHRIEKKPARKAKAEKLSAPKLATAAEQQAFVRQWEQSRPAAEDQRARLAAVNQELARLRQMFDYVIEFPGVHKGEGVQPAITWAAENERRLRLVFEQQLRLFWVRGALTPVTEWFRLAEPPVFPGAPKPPSFFDKKK